MALLSAFFHDDLRAQQNKWILSPTLIDFNTQTTAAQSWLSTVGYIVENTALDASGNVLFYIQNKSVMLPNGTVAGSLPNVQGNFCGQPGNLYTGILYEIAIVPVPGTCNRFYILWCAQKGVCGTALCATTITVNANGTLTIGSGQLVDEAVGASSALAVARSNRTDSRSLYWVGGLKGLVSYSISSSGISSGNTLYGYNSAGSFEGIEAEVDKNNGYVIWVDKQGEVYSASVTASSDNRRHYVLPTKRSAWGIEFDETEKGFYISTTQYFGGTASGIYHYTDLTDLSTTTLVSSTGDYEKTFIEKAKDNNFYAVNKNGILGKFTGNGIPCNASHSIASPCAASIYSASLNMGNSSGDVTFYSLKIYRVNCSTGSIEATIFDNTSTPITVSGVSTLTAIGLNDLTINGSTGYFVNKCCLCYRVEATIGNPCGSSTDYSYIKFTLPSCSCFDGGGGGDRSGADDRKPVGPGSIRVAPNPAAEAIRFISVEAGMLPEGLNLLIFNALGSAVLRVEHPVLDTPISICELPAGLYAYRLETTAGISAGQFLKQ